MTDATEPEAEQAVPQPPPEPMALDQALQILAQVCASFQGNLEQHQQIQTALDIVARAAMTEPLIVPEAETNGNRAQRRAAAKR